MPHTCLLLLIIILALSSTVPSKEKSPVDTTTAFSPDTLRYRYPHLWQRTSGSVKQTSDPSRSLARDSAVARSIRVMTKSNRKRALEFDEII